MWNITEMPFDPLNTLPSLTLPLLRLLTRSSQSSATSRPEVLPSFGQPDPNSLSSVAFLVWGSHVTRELSWSRWIQRKISGRLAPWPMRCWTLPSTTSSVWFPSFIEIWIGKKELKEYAKAMALVYTNCSTSMHWYSNYTHFAQHFLQYDTEEFIPWFARTVGHFKFPESQSEVQPQRKITKNPIQMGPYWKYLYSYRKALWQ